MIHLASHTMTSLHLGLRSSELTLPSPPHFHLNLNQPDLSVQAAAHLSSWLKQGARCSLAVGRDLSLIDNTELSGLDIKQTNKQINKAVTLIDTVMMLFTELLLTGHIIYLHKLFKLYKNAMRKILWSLSPFYIWENWGTERVGNSLKVT